MISFNLLDEPWVPVITVDGSHEWSVTEVLRRSQDVIQLDPARPLEWIPVFRLLQAVVIDALRGVDEASWGDRFRLGRFDPEVIENYLNTIHSRFDLFDPVAPFYQVASLEATSGEIKSVLALYPETASGNNVPLFSSILDSDASALSCPEAARRLLALLAWDTAGLKTGAKGDPQMSGGKTTGNPTGPLGLMGPIVPLGRNLFQSLMLNLPQSAPAPDDAPAWCRPPTTASWETRPSRGVLDLLTWQSRRVRLVTSPDGFPHVAGVVVTAGDRLDGIHPDQEPHTAWRVSDPAKGGMASRSIRHQMGRSFWRGMAAQLAGDDDSLPNAVAAAASRSTVLGRTYVLDLRTAGVVYGNQSAVIEHVFSDATPVSLLALDEAHGAAVREALGQITQRAEAVRLALNNLDNNLRRASGGKPIPWDKGERPGERFIASLDAIARQSLEALAQHPDDPGDAMDEWERSALRLAWAVAGPLLDADARATFKGRVDSKDKKKPLINQAKAESWFRAALRDALPDAYKAWKEKTDE